MGKRGPEAKDPAQLRHNEVRVYLTDAELEAVDQAAAAANMSRSRYIRVELMTSVDVRED